MRIRSARQDNRRESDDDGLSEVIGFLLIIAAITIIISVYFITAVPAEGRENEIFHMNGIKDRFIEFKLVNDALWKNDKGGIPAGTVFYLGTTGGSISAAGLYIPVLRPLPSNGVMRVGYDGDVVNVSWKSSGGDSFLEYYPGRIEYEAFNNYWVRQTYYYQSGGVFLRQNRDATMKAPPPLTVRADSPPTTTFVGLTGIRVYGDQEVSGYGPVRVVARLKEDSSLPFVNQTVSNVTIRITSAEEGAAELWGEVFEDAVHPSVPAGWYAVSVDEGAGTAELAVYGNQSGVLLDMNLAEYTVVIGEEI